MSIASGSTIFAELLVVVPFLCVIIPPHALICRTIWLRLLSSKALDIYSDSVTAAGMLRRIFSTSDILSPRIYCCNRLESWSGNWTSASATSVAKWTLNLLTILYSFCTIWWSSTIARIVRSCVLYASRNLVLCWSHVGYFLTMYNLFCTVTYVRGCLFPVSFISEFMNRIFWLSLTNLLAFDRKYISHWCIKSWAFLMLPKNSSGLAISFWGAAACKAAVNAANSIGSIGGFPETCTPVPPPGGPPPPNDSGFLGSDVAGCDSSLPAVAFTCALTGCCSSAIESDPEYPIVYNKVSTACCWVIVMVITVLGVWGPGSGVEVCEVVSLSLFSISLVSSAVIRSAGCCWLQ